MPLETRGRYTQCKLCKHQFKHENNDDRVVWQNTQYQCPSCKEKYCNMPKTERDLHTLQDIFVIDKDEKVLNRMYYILISYGKSLFLKTFRNFVFHEEDVKYYVENAVSLFIEENYYYKNRRITISFGGMLIFKLKQALYGKMESTTNAISIDYKLADNNTIQYEDKKNNFSYIEDEYDQQLLIKNLFEIITEISKYSDNPKENWMREQALCLHLVNGEKYADRFFRLYNKEGKLIYMYTLDVLKRQLKKSIEISYD